MRNTTQLNLTYQLNDSDIELKYIYGLNELIYRRTTDDDNTASQFHDRQFYVNHEASMSHTSWSRLLICLRTLH